MFASLISWWFEEKWAGFYSTESTLNILQTPKSNKAAMIILKEK